MKKARYLLFVCCIYLMAATTSHAAPSQFGYFTAPWATGETWVCTQGNFDTFTHNAEGRDYAWDFSCDNAEGMPVLAAAPGTVVSKVDMINGYLAGSWGNYVVLYHGNDPHGHALYTLYAHLKRGSLRNVWRGKHVSRAEQIGECGSTGDSNGPHLHFQVQFAPEGNSVPASFTDIGFYDGVPVTYEECRPEK